MKRVRKFISVAFVILLFLLVTLGIMGYFITNEEFRNPKEHYATIGKRVYTAVPAMMIDSLYDSLNLSGRGIKIGVLDVGFGGLRKRAWTKNLNVAAYANFINCDTLGFFKEKSGRERDHGAYSCACIGGYIAGDTIKGLAYNAEYYLAETDDFDSEPRLEEVRMMNAIRWLLAHNVDIITSSCGYTIFDDFDGYSVQMLDGQSSRISYFVDSLLQANPNLIFVQSMGNEGNKPWRYNNFPADVREVIAVGAIEKDSITHAYYSSIGWEGTEYIKPDVCAYVQPPRKGTSFSAPAIAGLCAALLEHKRMNRKELIHLLHSSGLNSSTPNREIGYGVPQTSRMSLSIILEH
ncbi:MAG: S8 family serine peptidase [Alistipes sp.]